MKAHKPKANCLALGLTAASLAISPPAVADGGYFIKPSISAFVVYDDNIFYTFNNKESASIARLTPSLEVGLEQADLTWNVNYRFDAEDYLDNSNIDSGITRRFADARLEYQATSRLQLNADVIYTKTDTPADLSLVPGGEIQSPLQQRTNAERITLNPAVTYILTPTATARLSYLHTRDNIEDVLETDIRRLALDMEHSITKKTRIFYGYFDREVRYDEASPTADSGPNPSRDSSGTSWAGVSQQLTPNVIATLRGGARVSGGTTDPYWQLSLSKEYRFGEAQIGYERNETTAPGTTGSQEFETINASLSYQSGLNWLTIISPSYAKLTQRAGEQKVYRLSITTTYSISNSWQLTASYEYNHQPVDFSEIDDEAIDRNVAVLGITYVYSD